MKHKQRVKLMNTFTCKTMPFEVALEGNFKTFIGVTLSNTKT